MRILKTPGASSEQAGSSLIEVLVSVFILAFGILGVAGMQTGALRNNQGALEQSSAVLLAHSILESMRASMVHDDSAESDDRSAMKVADGYSTSDEICKASDVTSSGAPGEDLKRWIGEIHASLNDDSACGQIVCETADPNLCTVTVKWNNSRALGGDAAQTVTARSRL
ncbi:MAG: type IV pilus modification protein PilV [Azoarcus sp.]|jgi:type IV pilus assembly protein PilV|nr:type IV pilus modification protein PilV [Azoarcus sp.]